MSYKKGISRRDFIKGAAASAFGVAAAGLLAGCSTESTTPAASPDASSAPSASTGRITGYSGPGDWLGEAPVISDYAKEVDVDVVVVGGGHAGVQAALAAAEAGLKVAVLERMEEDCLPGMAKISARSTPSSSRISASAPMIWAKSSTNSSPVPADAASRRSLSPTSTIPVQPSITCWKSPRKWALIRRPIPMIIRRRAG